MVLSTRPHTDSVGGAGTVVLHRLHRRLHRHRPVCPADRTEQSGPSSLGLDDRRNRPPPTSRALLLDAQHDDGACLDAARPAGRAVDRRHRRHPRLPGQPGIGLRNRPDRFVCLLARPRTAAYSGPASPARFAMANSTQQPHVPVFYHHYDVLDFRRAGRRGVLHCLSKGCAPIDHPPYRFADHADGAHHPDRPARVGTLDRPTRLALGDDVVRPHHPQYALRLDVRHQAVARHLHLPAKRLPLGRLQRR